MVSAQAKNVSSRTFASCSEVGVVSGTFALQIFSLQHSIAVQYIYEAVSFGAERKTMMMKGEREAEMCVKMVCSALDSSTVC